MGIVQIAEHILPNGVLNDESRASYMTANNSLGLSNEDSFFYYLIQDTIDGSAKASLEIKYNKILREVLYECI